MEIGRSCLDFATVENWVSMYPRVRRLAIDDDPPPVEYILGIISISSFRHSVSQHSLSVRLDVAFYTGLQAHENIFFVLPCFLSTLTSSFLPTAFSCCLTRTTIHVPSLHICNLDAGHQTGSQFWTPYVVCNADAIRRITTTMSLSSKLSITDLKLSDERVLIRVDFNVP